MSFSVVILISGRGSNMSALIDASRDKSYSVDGVISNMPKAEGLTKARERNVSTTILDDCDYSSREAYSLALVDILGKMLPDMICLAGFMPILSAVFFDQLKKCLPRCHILNIHPSLLPAFKGADAQKQALEAYKRNEITETGCTVHNVIEEMDSGTPLASQSVPIKPTDTVDTLSQRILTQEHHLYPRIVAQIARSS